MDERTRGRTDKCRPPHPPRVTKQCGLAVDVVLRLPGSDSAAAGLVHILASPFGRGGRVQRGRRGLCVIYPLRQPCGCQPPAQVAIINCSPLWLKICHRHIFDASRPHRGSQDGGIFVSDLSGRTQFAPTAQMGSAPFL